jgi:hypothetical protein
MFITFMGKVPSKKNMYTPRKGGMFKNKKLQGELDALSLQVPGIYRDRLLKHPGIEFWFTVPKNGTAADRDGKVTAIMDILVDMGVIKDDCIRECNGTMTIHPAKIGDLHQTMVHLYNEDKNTDEA